MSSHRVLVGLTAERVLPCGRLSELRPSYGFGPVRAVMRPRPGAGPLNRCQHSSPLLLRPFHTSRPAPDNNRGCRQPRTFTVSPPQPPTTRPPVPSPPSSPPSTSATPLPLPEQFRAAMRLLTHPAVVLTATDTTSSSPSFQQDTDKNQSTQPPPPPQQQPPIPGKGKGVPRAMTMSSLTSLALRPTPVVTCNIAVPSRTFDAVTSSGRFNVHVLADDVAGARVADWFAAGAGAGTANTGAGAGGAGAGAGTDTGGAAATSGAASPVVTERNRAHGGVAAAALQGREVFESLTAGDDGGGVQVVFDGSEPPLLRGDGVLYVLQCRLLRGEDGSPAQGWVRVRDHVIVLGEVVEIVEGARMKAGREDRFGLLYADRHYRQLGNCITPVDTSDGEREIDE